MNDSLYPDPFPVRVSHLDEPDVEDEICASFDDLGLELEFHDEFSKERVQVTSSTSMPLRVVAYALEVVLCTPVDRFVGPEDLRLSGCQASDGGFGIAELCLGQVHRILWPNGRAEPDHPLARVVDVDLVAATLPSIADFARRWASARSKRTWPS